jgi:hypothetical protein
MALDLADKTANGNTLTNVNTATEVTASLPFVESTIAADLELSSSQYFTANDSVSLSITGAISIELWFKFESTGTVQTLVSKLNATGNQRSYFFEFVANTLQFSLSTDGTSGTIETESVAWTPSTATWYHLAVTWDPTANECKFYVDGSQQGATQTVTANSIFDSTSKLLIGAQNEASPSQFCDGVIDDVRIWNDVRTITEIANNRSIELTGSEANLAAYWPFETVLGTDQGGYINFLN